MEVGVLFPYGAICTTTGLLLQGCEIISRHYPAKVEKIFTKHGTKGFTICGGISGAHDEAFFFWLIQEHEHLRSRIFSKDFSGTLYTTFDDEDPADIGVNLDSVPLEDYTDVSSVTVECIGLRLAREGKLRALEAGDGYEFILPDAPPLKVWAVLGSSKENALKALDVALPNLAATA